MRNKDLFIDEMTYTRGKNYPTPREDQKDLQLAKSVNRFTIQGNEKFHSHSLILIPLKVPQLYVTCAP